MRRAAHSGAEPPCANAGPGLEEDAGGAGGDVGAALEQPQDRLHVPPHNHNVQRLPRPAPQRHGAAIRTAPAQRPFRHMVPCGGEAGIRAGSTAAVPRRAQRPFRAEHSGRSGSGGIWVGPLRGRADNGRSAPSTAPVPAQPESGQGRALCAGASRTRCARRHRFQAQRRTDALRRGRTRQAPSNQDDFQLHLVSVSFHRPARLERPRFPAPRRDRREPPPPGQLGTRSAPLSVDRCCGRGSDCVCVAAISESR